MGHPKTTRPAFTEAGQPRRYGGPLRILQGDHMTKGRPVTGEKTRRALLWRGDMHTWSG